MDTQPTPKRRLSLSSWILGLDAEEKKPRWSVIRNVFNWVA